MTYANFISDLVSTVFALLCANSSFAIILMGKRELVALLCLSVLLVSHACCVALPLDTTGLSAVGECGIS